MKKSGTFAASIAAASATAISAASVSSIPSDFAGDSKPQFPNKDSKQHHEKNRSDAAAKFEPRFDGLRFIETLVTAHR